MPKKKSPNSVRIRNSTAEFLTFAYQTGGDGVEVRVQDSTIWLSQKSIGQLFETTPENVLMHLKNIYAENELSEAATTKEFLAVQTEGKRQVQRSIRHYNLDAIIAVGYRVNSKRATAFRQWATGVLRDYTLRGYPPPPDRFFGQEKNITTYNLARMNMLLHGVKDTEFEIFHGDTLTNDWEMLKELNPAKKPYFDAIVANPPFSYRWDPTDAMGDDVRFKNHGLAPKSAADFAFLLHGFHFLKDEGVMAIILPHGVLFRGGAEERIRTKLLKDGHIDTVIGLPANLFYSTGIPVCILVLKKCKKPDDVLFINAAEHFEKGKRQNRLTEANIAKIIDTYQFRKEEDRYSKRISMERITEEGYNLNISRYISTAVADEEIELEATHEKLVEIESAIQTATAKHNEFLKELGLPLLPGV